MHTFYGRPRFRDGTRNTPTELEGCLGVKISNCTCSWGCFGAAVFFSIAATVVILVLKFKYHMF